MAILMSRSGREQFLTALHLESLTRYLAAYLAYVPASWQSARQEGDNLGEYGNIFEEAGKLGKTCPPLESLRALQTTLCPACTSC